MITTTYGRFSAMHTASNEVVTRLATEHDEDSQATYHTAKLDYQLSMNRFASHLPPTRPPVPVVGDVFDTYCSSKSPSLNVTMNRTQQEESLAETIDRMLYSRAMARREADAAKEPSWKRGEEGKVPTFLRRESLARQDVLEVQRHLREKITTAFDAHPFKKLLALQRAERQARRAAEDAWVGASLPFIDALRALQAECAVALWGRAFGGAARAARAAKAKAAGDEETTLLDLRLYVPLLHRSDTIRRETEAEEFMAFRYVLLGEATQRDLIATGVMARGRDSGLIDSTQHPIYFQHYDAVDLAFGAEARYIVEEEETRRMAIVDEALTEKGEICKECLA